MDVHSCCTKLDSFSPDDVVMNEEIQWFGYEKGFDIDEVPPTEVRKRWIDINTIVSVLSQEERKNIFVRFGQGWGRIDKSVETMTSNSATKHN